MFLYKKFVPTTLADALLTASVMTVLLVFICAGVIGGTLLWLIDHVTINPIIHEVPFLEGIGNSFYWAIVSSATVGYGDIVPLSK